MGLRLVDVIIPEQNGGVVTDEYITDLGKEIGHPIFPIYKICGGLTDNTEEVTPEQLREIQASLGLEMCDLYVDENTKFFFMPMRDEMISDEWLQDYYWIDVDSPNVLPRGRYNDYFDRQIIMASNYCFIFSVRYNNYEPERGRETANTFDSSGCPIRITIQYNPPEME